MKFKWIKILNKGLRIFAVSVIILEIVVFLITGYVIWNFDSSYPLPYVPAWMLPVALASIIFKTTCISYLVFGKWEIKFKQKG
jgi:cytochrome b subunit of formate dehydrogenase